MDAALLVIEPRLTEPLLFASALAVFGLDDDPLGSEDWRELDPEDYSADEWDRLVDAGADSNGARQRQQILKTTARRIDRAIKQASSLTSFAELASAVRVLDPSARVGEVLVSIVMGRWLAREAPGLRLAKRTRRVVYSKMRESFRIGVGGKNGEAE